MKFYGVTIQIKPFLAELSDGTVVFQHFMKTSGVLTEFTYSKNTDKEVVLC